MSLLDTNDQTVTISLYYTEKDTKSGYKKVLVLEDEEAKKLLADESKREQVKTLSTTWKLMTWKDDNQIVRQSVKTSLGTGLSELDPFLYRDKKIKNCMVNWDLTNDKGQPIPFAPNLVDKMPADIVYALINKYEEITGISEEEEKKS